MKYLSSNLRYMLDDVEELTTLKHAGATAIGS